MGQAGLAVAVAVGVALAALIARSREVAAG